MPNNTSDFIPAPAASDNTVVASNGTGSSTASPNVNVSVGAPGLGTTQLILAAVILLVAAGVFYFVRNGIRNALTSARATVEAANFAASLWYVFLLLLTAILVFGLLGGFFKTTAFLIGAAVFVLLFLAVCAVVTSNARKTRK